MQIQLGNTILFHGSQNKYVIPTYGIGEDKHDYGKGFYLTENKDLASEWAVYNPTGVNGWVHTYSFKEGTNLKILDFKEYGTLAWLAELMKYRDADSSRRYRVLAPKFIQRYQVDTNGYDIIRGRRANASYFYIAKSFVRDEIDLEILPELLKLGDLGIQYCLKSERAFSSLQEDYSALLPINYFDMNPQYSKRDRNAREAMYELINSDKNKIEKVFSSLI